MKEFTLTKKIIIALWALFLIFCAGFFLINPHLFTPAALAEFLTGFKGYILGAYIAASILRGFTLIPSTPFVLAGTILFPGDLFWVLAISMTGIIFSSSMIYYFSDRLGFGALLERRHPERIARIQSRLERSGGAFFVFLWSFMPVLPTDAVCYAAGTLRMHFWKFIAAMALGELVLCSIYIFFYSHVVGLFG